MVLYGSFGQLHRTCNRTCICHLWHPKHVAYKYRNFSKTRHFKFYEFCFYSKFSRLYANIVITSNNISATRTLTRVSCLIKAWFTLVVIHRRSIVFFSDRQSILHTNDHRQWKHPILTTSVNQA
jgi:hypothetical protein